MKSNKYDGNGNNIALNKKIITSIKLKAVSFFLAIKALSKWFFATYFSILALLLIMIASFKIGGSNADNITGVLNVLTSPVLVLFALLLAIIIRGSYNYKENE